VNFPETIKLLD